MNTKLNVTALMLALIVSISSLAQDFSNKGKDFWVVYTGHIDGTSSRMALYITSDQNASGTVTVAGSVINFTVTANQVTTVRFTNSSNPSNNVCYNGQTVGVGVNKGIHIVTDKPVVVYAHILNSARSGSTLILPTNVLGRDYYVASYGSVGSSGGSTRRSEFAVVASEDNTTVEITPNIPDANNTYQANVPFQISLNKGDVFQYQSANDNDLTGTHIKSIATANSPCKPIGVFSGSTWTAIGCGNASSGDNLYQQLFPFVSWGKLYYTAPFKNRAFDIFRILVQDPSTVVSVNGTPLNPSTLKGGRYYEISTLGNNTPRIISSDKPICVFQYMITQSCDGIESDPEMVILNSIDQTLNDITVMSARKDLTPPNTNITSHYLNIIFKTNTLNSLRIDGAPPTATPIPITGTGYSYIQEDVTASTNNNPAHRIVSDSGFICIAYGYGNVESYGYNAGTNVRDLYQFVSIKNEYGSVNFPATCKNSPFFLSMTFPYQPTQIQWQFNGLFPDVTVNNPKYDSTWMVNGKQLYLYNLPNTYSTANAGTYTIKVVAQNPTPDGCNGQQEISYDLKVYDKPVADFTFTSSGCSTDSVHFSDNINTNGRTTAKWSWDFGDGTTSSIHNPAQLYKIPGTYNIKFSVITDIGCLSDTVSKTIAISEPPVAKFGISTPNCINKAISFFDSSYANASGIVKWIWDFGDGSPQVIASSNATQTHIYTASGATVTASLTVQSATGCQSTVFSKKIAIGQTPAASFNFGNACLPDGLMQFTDQSGSNDPVQPQLSYLWDFGDGTTSTQQNPLHKFVTTGPFTVNLTVTSNAGCTNTASKQVTTVYAQPQADFQINKSEICLNDTLQFTDQSNATASSVKQWYWDFGDGTPIAMQQNPSHLYSTSGTFVVKHYVRSAIGCVSDTAIKTVIVNPLPAASFSVSSPNCVNAPISFINNSVANAGNINEWNWNFGDGSAPLIAGAGTNQTHSFAATGSYNISLQVKTDKGCVNQLERPIVVHPLPLPNFSLPDNCPADPVSLFNDSTSINGAGEHIASYVWDFGDLNATTANPNTSSVVPGKHRYAEAGSYTVSLTTTSNNGCMASVSKPFVLNGAQPQAAFTIAGGTQLCSNDSLVVINNSSVSPGRIIKLEIYWDYTNDPTNKSIIQYPQYGQAFAHLYPLFYTPATQTYTVKVFAYSGENCVDAASAQTVTVKAVPQIQFNALTPVCGNDAAFQINASVSNITGSGLFSGTGVSSSGVYTPQKVSAGTYDLQYVFTASNGCINTIQQAITVYPVPTVNAGPDLFVLEGGSSILSASGSGNNINYVWTPNRWLNNTTIPQPVTTATDDITYTLTVTSADGCKDSDQVFVKVLKAPTIPNTFSPNGDGMHDTWEIKYLDTYPDCTVEIYNRYGQLVFQSVGYSKPWDGTFKGSPLPVGTYYYIINPKHGRKQIAGFVDIIR